jgi:hypothetical protein
LPTLAFFLPPTHRLAPLPLPLHLILPSFCLTPLFDFFPPLLFFSSPIPKTTLQQPKPRAPKSVCSQQPDFLIQPIPTRSIFRFISTISSNRQNGAFYRTFDARNRETSGGQQEEEEDDGKRWTSRQHRHRYRTPTTNRHGQEEDANGTDGTVIHTAHLEATNQGRDGRSTSTTTTTTTTQLMLSRLEDDGNEDAMGDGRFLLRV